MERQAFRQDRAVTSFDPGDQTRLQRHVPLARQVRRVASAAQKALHLARPGSFLDLDQRLQFPQMVRVTQRVQHASQGVVGLPVVVHDDARHMRQQAAALGRDAVEREPDGRGDVQPLRLAADMETGFITCLTGAAATRSRTASAKPWKRWVRIPT